MAKIDPFKFLQEVRAEAQKVTWPTRKETTVTTMMVFVMVFVTSIFFLLADQVMRLGIRLSARHQLLGGLRPQAIASADEPHDQPVVRGPRVFEFRE